MKQIYSDLSQNQRCQLNLKLYFSTGGTDLIITIRKAAYLGQINQGSGFQSRSVFWGKTMKKGLGGGGRIGKADNFVLRMNRNGDILN